VVASKVGGNNTKIQGTVVRFHCYPGSRNQPCKWPPTSNVTLKELQWRNLPNPIPAVTQKLISGVGRARH